jgi:hypothetical protein
MVCGPVSAETEEEREANIDAIDTKILELDQEGWHVLGLKSFHPKLDELSAQHAARPEDYSYFALNEFIVPIIQSGWIKYIHIRHNWHQNEGSKVEYQTALEAGVNIILF